MKGQIHPLKLINLYRFSIPSSSISRFNASTNFNKVKFSSILKARSMQLSLSPLNIAANYLRNFRVSGSYMCCGSILGVSFASAPIIAHAMDAGDALVDIHESMDLSEEEENGDQLWRLTRKFWLPAFFLLTVLTNLDDSITRLFIKLTLFLLTTKPNPFSVYEFVDQLCQQFMSQETRFLRVKSLYASKVEVQDYKLLCLADVEVRDQKFTLVGILGSWWTWPHLPFLGSILFCWK